MVSFRLLEITKKLVYDWITTRCRFEGEIDLRNSLSAHLRSFIIGNSRRILNTFIHEISGFKTDTVYYTDTYSVYIEKKRFI